MATCRCSTTPRLVGAPLPAGCHPCRNFAPRISRHPADSLTESTCHHWLKHQISAPRVVTMLPHCAISDPLTALQTFQGDLGHAASGSPALPDARDHTNESAIVPLAQTIPTPPDHTFGLDDAVEMEEHVTKVNAVRSQIKLPTPLTPQTPHALTPALLFDSLCSRDPAGGSLCMAKPAGLLSPPCTSRRVTSSPSTSIRCPRSSPSCSAAWRQAVAALPMQVRGHPLPSGPGLRSIIPSIFPKPL